MSVIIIPFSASPLSLQQLHLQNVFAQKNESQTGIEQRLGQKNLGSGESTNFNCADNTLEGSPSSLSLCQSAEPPEEEPPQEESATLSVCKSAAALAGREFVFAVTGNNPSPAVFTVVADRAPPNCVDVTIGPGEYTVTEDPSIPVSGTFLLEGSDCVQDPNNDQRATGEIQAGVTQECIFFNFID
jgi:hypothetical protein